MLTSNEGYRLILCIPFSRLRCHVVIAGMVKVIEFIITHNITTRPFDHHKDDGGRQDTPCDDQQQFHGPKITMHFMKSTPAKVSPWQSADLAMNGRNERGNSAHVSIFGICVFMGSPEMEDPPWLTTHNRRPAAQAASVSSLPQSLSCWSCFMRCLRAVRSKRQLIRLPLARLRQHLCLKKLHRLHLPFPAPNKATHFGHSEGGRSDASAFVVRVGNTPRTKVCPC